MMAKVLGVSRSGCYSWVSNGCLVDDRSEALDAVRRVRLESDRRFGARLVRCFPPDGLRGITLYRVRKCMRGPGNPRLHAVQVEEDDGPRRGRQAKARPDQAGLHEPGAHPQALRHITHLRTGQGWLYLSTAIDLNARMAVGRSLSERMTADIVASAPESAQARGRERHIPLGQGGAVHRPQARRAGQGRPCAPPLQPHRRLPRQRRRRVVLRDAEK